MPRKLKLAVLISGRGSNMLALLEACKNPDFPAEIVAVLSNNQDAAGLKKAQESEISTEVVDHRTFENREAFDRELDKTIKKHSPDIICLAGFMRILTPWFIDEWARKIINIHPSLLPDYKGLHTHERVLADGKTQSGCTVHYATAEMDEGEIIVQKEVPVHPDDTPEALAARVLEAEHIAYPEAVLKIAENFKFT